MLLNADTLTNKMPEFQLLVRHHKPEIICVNEVLPKNFNRQIYPEEFALEGYDMISHSNVANNIGRGTILYVHRSLVYKQIFTNALNSFEESVAVEINLNKNDRLLCAGMYRRGESTDENNEKLIEVFSELTNLNNSHLLIMGDLNFKQIKWESLSTDIYNPDDINNKFVECVRDNFLFQHITEPTRQRGSDTPSTLDLIFTNEENMIPEVDINSPLGNSDHATILFFIKGKFSKKFSIPLDEKNLKKLKKKNKMWTKIRKDLASEEEKLHYKKLRNQVRRLTRKGKKLHEKTIAKNAKSNPKAFWQYAQSKLKTRSEIPDLIKPGSENEPQYTSSDHEKADIFLDYFSSVFTSEPTGCKLPNFNKRNYVKELDNIKITIEMVEKKLRKIKINKSPGPDAIHPKVLHEVTSAIMLPLANIFATSIQTKTLPDEWKHAQVSAIFKKGKKTLPNNYRPVSLTCIVCKILESIIRDHIITHMTENNLFSPRQFGFISGRSTTLQLLHVLNIWTEILDQGGSLDIILWLHEGFW